MNEESFKKVLYLIFKVLIQSNGYLSQLEIFKEVRILLNNSFNIKEIDLTIKLGQGKSEDFKDILNFTLTILCELDLVSEKMENKSFYFKWNSMKGFYRKYIPMFREDKDYEINESIEHRSQIYTRYLLLLLFKKRANSGGIVSKDIDSLILKCGLEGQSRYPEKIHAILTFINFIIRVAQNKEAYYQLFTLITDKNTIFNQHSHIANEQTLYIINQDIFNEEVFALAKTDSELAKLSEFFNHKILNKGMELGEKIDNDDDNKEIETQKESPEKVHYEHSSKENEHSNTQKNNISGNGLSKYKIKIESYNNEYSDVGFALLRGDNWVYYIKKLHCIIGRKPMKYNTNSNPVNTTWEIDVDLGPGKKISKQHALIVYNFSIGSFEIKNLSKKFPIKINGELINYNEEKPLNSKAQIFIGNQEFYFLLPH